MVLILHRLVFWRRIEQSPPNPKFLARQSTPARNPRRVY